MPRIQTTKVYTELDQAIRAGYTTISEQGSSRSGKTFNTVIWLCAYLMNRAGLRLSVVRKTLTALRGSVLLDFKEVLTLMGLWTWREKAFNKSDFTFTFPNGSWIEFFSTDDEQKLRGRKRDICYVNEANELSYLEWQQLKMRTTMFTVADYNPSFSDEHWLCTVNSDPRTYHFITTYKDNPFLEQTIVDEIESLRNKNKSLWQIYGLGQQAVVEGLIFTNVEIIDEIPHYATRRHWRGMDFGYHPDPTAVEDVYYHDNTLYVDEICYQTDLLTADIIRIVLYVVKIDAAHIQIRYDKIYLSVLRNAVFGNVELNIIACGAVKVLFVGCGCKRIGPDQRVRICPCIQAERDRRLRPLS